MAFSPDGKTVLTGSIARTLQLWDATTGRPIGKALKHEMEHGQLLDHPLVVFSPIVERCSLRARQRLWDLATAQLVGKPLEHQGWVHAAALGPDGKTILTGSNDGTTRQWDAGTGEPNGKALERRGDVNTIAFSADRENRCLTGSTDTTGKALEPHHGATHRAAGSAGVPRTCRSRGLQAQTTARLSLPAAKAGRRRLWDATGRPIGNVLEHEGGIAFVAFNPNSRAVLTPGLGYGGEAVGSRHQIDSSANP